MSSAADGSRSGAGPGQIRALVAAYAQGNRSVGAELQRLGVLEGAPAAPAGEYAQYLVAETLSGQRVSAKGYGVVANGKRFQVRGRHRKPYRDPTYFAVDFDPAEQQFDFLVAVLFATDFSIAGAWRIPWDAVPRLAVRYRNTGYRLMVAGPWKDDKQVQPLCIE